MSTQITGSTNIYVLDSKIIADICAGSFKVDITPSIFADGGELNVLGAKVKIINPQGITIKDYPSSTYDIASADPMDGISTLAIPTEAGNYKYGTYTIIVQLFDADNTVYEISKTVSICAPNSKDKTKNYGILSADLIGRCKDGKLSVIVNTPPTYKGNLVESTLIDLTLEYPTSSGLDELTTELDAFSVQLFEGVYKLTGDICATYNYGDNVYASVPYRIKVKKEIFCSVDETCVLENIRDLQVQLDENCDPNKAQAIYNKILLSLSYLKTAQLAADAGVDPSEEIGKLQDLLGCKCTCTCEDGTPILNNEPSQDIVIEGCNVVKSVVGTTDHYQIDNYEYAVTVNPNNTLTVGTPTQDDCTITIPLNFNLANLVASLSEEIIAQNGLNSSIDGDDKLVIKLGGALTENTAIPLGVRTLSFSAASTLFEFLAGRFTASVADIFFTLYPNTRDDSGVTNPINILYTDGNGKLLSAPLSANNGLTKALGNFKLGGTLLQNTTIALAGFTFTLSNGVGYWLFNGERVMFGSASDPANMLMGYDAAYGHPGTNLFAWGPSALINGSGSQKIAIGIRAIRQNIGDRNVAIGHYSGQTTNGSDNTLVGDVAANHSNVDQSTMIGSATTAGEILGTVSIANSNIIIEGGPGTWSSSKIGGLAAFFASIGVGASYIGAFRVDLGDGAGVVGASGIAPLVDDGLGRRTLYIEKGQIQSDGDTLNLFQGKFADKGGTDGLGTGATLKITAYANVVNSVVIGYIAHADASNQVSLGNTNVTQLKSNTLRIKANATHSKGQRLIFDGTQYIPEIIAYQTLTYGATTTWNVDLGYKAKVTLTGNTTLAITNAVAGTTGRILVVQDGTGGRTLTLPASSKVINGGSGAVTLTATADAEDMLVFEYDGTTYRWRIEPNYT